VAAPPRLSTLARRLPAAVRSTGVLDPRVPDSIPLLGGNPAADALPAAELATATAEVLAEGGPALRYSDPRGLERLRGWLAGREGVTPERIVVTNGGLHGVSLVVQALLDPGEEIVVDDPVYPTTLRVLQLADARPVPVPVGPAGLDVERLERRLADGLRPRIVYTVADFQNPTGTVLAGDARTRLVELAERYGFVVLSDNPYRISRFAGTDVPDLPAASERVVKVSTFAKSLGPGLRLGWLVLPEWLVEAVVALRTRTDQHPSSLVQAAIARLVDGTGVFEATTKRLAELHGLRANALVAALRERLGDVLEAERPDGGFFVWARLREGAPDLDALHAAAAAHGTSFSRGTSFAVPGGGEHRDRIRLGFSDLPEASLREAVDRLAAAVEEVRR